MSVLVAVVYVGGLDQGLEVRQIDIQLSHIFHHFGGPKRKPLPCPCRFKSAFYYLSVVLIKFGSFSYSLIWAFLVLIKMDRCTDFSTRSMQSLREKCG